MQQASRHIVEERSMAPTLLPGDRILSRRRPLRVGDVVVATAPSGLRVVKRVAALGPCVVEVDAGHVLVDGEPEHPESVDATPGTGRWVVPANGAFLLSDARHRTTADSRSWGPVDRSAITGTVVFRYRPLRRMGRPHG